MVNNTRKNVHLGKYVFIHCSRITVVNVHVYISSKMNPECHNDANGIKAGSNYKMTDKHVAGCSKVVYLGVHLSV